MIQSAWQPVNRPAVPVEPSRVREVFIIVLLVVGLVVDIAAFNIALQTLQGQATALLTWTISVGLSAIAMLLMVEGGYLEAKRRERTAAGHGKGVIRLMILIWLALGATATLVRMSTPAADDGDLFASGGASDPFASAGADPFATAAEGTFGIGPLTFYTHDMLTALLMLALYLGVGVAAYQFGRSSDHPQLSGLRQTRRALKRARRRLASTQNRLDQALALETAQRDAAAQEARRREDLHRISAAASAVDRAKSARDHAMSERTEAEARFRAVAAEEAGKYTELSAAEAQLAALDPRTKARLDEAAAVGETAKQHARHHLHTFLADPARTVMTVDAGHPNGSIR